MSAFEKMEITRQEAAALLDMLPGLIDSGHPNLTARYGGLNGSEVLENLHYEIVVRFEAERRS